MENASSQPSQADHVHSMPEAATDTETTHTMFEESNHDAERNQLRALLIGK